MSTRQQRRRAAREAAKNRRHGKSEVFIYTDENGSEQWLDVEQLRQWAEENQLLVGVDLDAAKVEQILRSGRVSKEHVMQHTLTHEIRPIIVALDYHNGQAEIVDGNHTYLAMAFTTAKASEIGIVFPEKIPAYCIEREDWMKFIVPSELRTLV